jgi:hypothetical protein
MSNRLQLLQRGTISIYSLRKGCTNAKESSKLPRIFIFRADWRIASRGSKLQQQQQKGASYRGFAVLKSKRTFSTRESEAKRRI